MRTISHLAYKFHNNPIAKVLIRPIWRSYITYKVNKQKKSLHKNGLELLKKIDQSSLMHNYTYWLDFGTLLGAYRENDFIKHDYDMDIAALYTDHKTINKALIKMGFKLIKRFYSNQNNIDALEETYKYKGIFMDIFYYHIDTNEQMHCNSFSPFKGEIVDPSQKYDKLQVKKIILPYTGFQRYKFKNIYVNIPNNPKQYLASHYGENFMTPNKDFDYRKEATNIYYYSKEELLGTVEVFF